LEELLRFFSKSIGELGKNGEQQTKEEIANEEEEERVRFSPNHSSHIFFPASSER
jgi:hypothetical protein